MSANSNVTYANFDPNGRRLRARIIFQGLVIGSYEYQLWEADSNEIIDKRAGNNQNQWDDDYLLPVPVNFNVGRLIDVRAKFVGLDPVNSPEFKIIVQLFQGDELIGEGYDASSETRILDGNGQESQIYIFLNN